MEYFNLCSKVIQEEKKKSTLNHQEIIRRTAEFSLSDNFFESPYDRCAFMYKNATCIINFTIDCICKFLRECPFVTDMFSKWKVRPSLHFCSFSHGPALDYLSFCAALSDCLELNLQPSFSRVNVISNSAQWKHAIHFMMQAIKMGYLRSFPVSTLCDNFIVNQNPRLAFNEKQTIAVQEADVVFMVKTLNFSKPDEFDGRKRYFQNIIAAMKSDSYLFCIDTKPSISAMFEIFDQFSGQLIYGPVLNSYQLPEKFPETFKEIYGCLPVVSARGNFFVWKKMSLQYLVPNLCVTNSEKLSTNPVILTDNKANLFNQHALVVTVLKPDITTESSEVCSTDKKSGDLFLFNNQNIRNIEELNDRNENLSSQLGTPIQLQPPTVNDVKTEDVVKSVVSNFGGIDQTFQPVSILDQLFSKLSPEKPKLPPETTFSMNDISLDASLGCSEVENKCNLQGVDQSFITKNGQDLTCESETLLKTPTCDFNIQPSSIESSNFCPISFIEWPPLSNKELDATKLTDSLAVPNSIKEVSSSQNINEMCGLFDSEQLGNCKAGSLSSVFTDSSNSLKSISSSIRSKRRSGKKSLKARTNSKNIKIVQSSTPVKVIPLYSSVCALPTLRNSDFKQKSNIGKEETNKSQITGGDIKNSDEHLGFLNAGLNKGYKLLDEDKKITNYGSNDRNNSLRQTSLIVPKNEKFELTTDDDDDSDTHLFHNSVSTTTDIEKSYMDSGSEIQHLINRIKTLVSSFEQKEKSTDFRHDKTTKQFHDHFCSCLSSGRNVANINNCFPSCNIVTNKKFQNLEGDSRDSNIEFKNSCLPQSSICCATQFRCHQCCAYTCRKVRECACTSITTYSPHGCFHCAKQCAPSSDLACTKCIAHDQASPTVPNIVIPLQNITEDALAQILATLKASNPHSPYK